QKPLRQSGYLISNASGKFGITASLIKTRRCKSLKNLAPARFFYVLISNAPHNKKSPAQLSRTFLIYLLSKESLSAEFRHHFVRYFEIGINVLHVIIIFQCVDELEHGTCFFFIHIGVVLRFPDSLDGF